MKNAGIEDIVQFIDSYENLEVEGLSEDDLKEVYDLIKENVEIVEEEADEESSEAQEEIQEEAEEEKYVCPECGAEITLDMTHCPKCGVEFEFAEDEE